MWNRRQTTKFNGASYIIQKRAAAAVSTEEGQSGRSRPTSPTTRPTPSSSRRDCPCAGLTVYGAVNSPYVWVQDSRRAWVPGNFSPCCWSEANVVTTPGAGFGPSGEGYIRLTAFGDADATQEAVERIRAIL